MAGWSDYYPSFSNDLRRLSSSFLARPRKSALCAVAEAPDGPIGQSVAISWRGCAKLGANGL